MSESDQQDTILIMTTNLTSWTEYPPVRTEMRHVKPELMLLALSLTTFYRKSFSFSSQGPLVVLSLMMALCVWLSLSPLILAIQAVVLILHLGSRQGQSQW